MHIQQDSDRQRLIGAVKPLALLLTPMLILAFFVTSVPAGGLAAHLLTAIAGVWAVLGGPYLGAEISRRMVSNFTNAVSPYSTNVYRDPDTIKYDELHARYLKFRDQLSTQNTEHLDYYFHVYHTWLYDVSDPNWQKYVLRYLVQYLEYAFNVLEVPIRSIPKELSVDFINDKVQKLIALLEVYPKQRDVLLNFARIMGHCQMRDFEYKNIRALYLVGPPGVGKTTLIQDICNLFEVNLTILKGKRTVNFNNGMRQFWDPIETYKASTLCQVLDASHSIKRYGYNVVLFDEVDKLPEQSSGNGSEGLPSRQAVSQHLLELTDNEQKYILDSYTGMYAPKTRLIVIIAVNKDHFTQAIDGFASRVDTVIFDPISPENKMKIALRKLDIFCAENNVTKTPEILETVTEIVKNNKEEGVRELVETLRSLIYDLAQNSFYEPTILGRSTEALLYSYKQQAQPKDKQQDQPMDFTPEEYYYGKHVMRW